MTKSITNYCITPMHMGAFLCIAVSMYYNFRYGYVSGGESGAVLSVASDLMKATAFYYLIKYLAEKDFARAVSAAILLFLTAGYSLITASGYASLNRTEMTDSRAGHKDTRSNYEQALSEAKQTLAALGKVRLTAIIQSDITKYSDRVHSKIWNRTAECRKIRTGSDKWACKRHLRLYAEMSKAIAVEKAKDKLAKARKGISITPRVEQVDPQAAMISHWTGIDQKHIPSGITLCE